MADTSTGWVDKSGETPPDFTLLTNADSEASNNVLATRLEEQHVFGSPSLPIGRDTRLIYIARRIYAEHPESVTWMNDVDPRHPSMELAGRKDSSLIETTAGHRAVQARDNVVNFLSKKKTIRGESSQVYSLGNARSVILSLWDQMKKAEHPAYQIAEFVWAANNRRKLKNENSVIQLPVLSDDDLGNLLLDLIYSTQAAQLMRLVEINLSHRKQSSTINNLS